MSQMEIDRVLAQIRSISAQAKIGGLARRRRAPPAQRAGKSGATEFANLLKQGIDSGQPDAAERRSSLATAFEKGMPGVELPQVMLEMQKASVSFRALTEVRNRLVNAYQEIMNMPI